MFINYSIIIPAYNEEGNLIPLFDEIKTIMNNLGQKWEVIFIDDGSTDGTITELESIEKLNPELKIISLRKNFGQSAAINCGFHYSKGKILIVMDADRQNDPNDIPKLLEKMEDGFDVVSGWRYNRKDNLLKKIPSRFQNWLHRRLTGLKIHDSGCSLKSYSRESIESVVIYGEMHRYIPALVSKQGFRVGELKTNHRKRTLGKYNFGFKRLFRGFFDLIYLKFWLSYSAKPIHLFGWLSVISILFALLTLLYNFVRYGFDFAIGPTLLLSGMSLVIAVQFFVLGILSELLVRLFYSSPENKPYNIKKLINIDE